MEARRKRIEELNITRDEINNIGKALQQEEFRKLFVEYCEEVTSPESRKVYQSEVTELEKQRGVDVTFIDPEPGFVVKTSINGDRKAFINICKNDKVAKPSSSEASEAASKGRRWSLPFSLAPPREDYDKNCNQCTVIDVVFNPETLQLAQKNMEFRKMVIDTALNAVEDNCKSKLDRANLKYPKMTYKGLPRAAVVRKKIPNYKTAECDKDYVDQIPYPSEESVWASVQNETRPAEMRKVNAEFTLPKYSIKYRHDIEMSDFTNDSSSRLNVTVPKALIIAIDLPLLKSAQDLSLDILHKSLFLLCKMPKYKLDIVLPYGVDEKAGNASFDVSSRKLTVELIVKHNTPSLIDVGREDSGVESDPGGRADDDFDERSRSDNSDGGSDSEHHLLNEVSSSVCDATLNNGDALPHTNNILENDIDYILPNFSLNSFDNTVAVVLHVKNVEANSMAQSIMPEGHGIQLTFTSLGGGLFPQPYGFCMAFPNRVHMKSDSLTVEVWDNNVVVQVALSVNMPISEILVGTRPENLQVRDITNLDVVDQMLSDLQENTENVTYRSPLVEVHAAEESELVLKIEPFSSEGGNEQNGSDNSCTSKQSETPISNILDENMGSKARRNAVRQLSECSSDDLNGKKIRGILKKRPVRSLSESNADDYALYHSTSPSDESGPSSLMGSVTHIGDGGSETGCDTENESGDRHSKKTVRFNDVVAKKVFRPNSSIMGQRKKNQRKSNSKKRAKERRASESSELESEQEKARRHTSYSEGEVSDLEEKNTRGIKDKFLKDLKVEPCGLEAKKILRRTNSSESDEDIKEGKKNGGEGVISAGDSALKTDTSAKKIQVLPRNEESSEDERDDKTEDKKKKKKKKKGKNISDNGDCCKHETKSHISDFKNNLVLELEM